MLTLLSVVKLSQKKISLIKFLMNFGSGSKPIQKPPIGRLSKTTRAEWVNLDSFNLVINQD